MPYMDVGPLSSLLYLFLCSCSVLVRDSYGVVDWMFTGEPFGSHSTHTLFSLSFNPVFAFLSSLSLSLSLSLCVSLVCSTEVRSKERGILERAGVIQSLTVGVGPIVLVIASVCTFTLHMALGYDLTAAQVFRRTTRKLFLKQFKCDTYASTSIKSRSILKSRVANNCLALNTSRLRLSPWLPFSTPWPLPSKSHHQLWGHCRRVQSPSKDFRWEIKTSLSTTRDAELAGMDVKHSVTYYISHHTSWGSTG